MYIRAVVQDEDVQDYEQDQDSDGCSTRGLVLFGEVGDGEEDAVLREGLYP